MALPLLGGRGESSTDTTRTTTGGDQQEEIAQLESLPSREGESFSPIARPRRRRQRTRKNKALRARRSRYEYSEDETPARMTKGRGGCRAQSSSSSNRLPPADPDHISMAWLDELPPINVPLPSTVHYQNEDADMSFVLRRFAKPVETDWWAAPPSLLPPAQSPPAIRSVSRKQGYQRTRGIQSAATPPLPSPPPPSPATGYTSPIRGLAHTEDRDVITHAKTSGQRRAMLPSGTKKVTFAPSKPTLIAIAPPPAPLGSKHYEASALRGRQVSESRSVGSEPGRSPLYSAVRTLTPPGWHDLALDIPAPVFHQDDVVTLSMTGLQGFHLPKSMVAPCDSLGLAIIRVAEREIRAELSWVRMLLSGQAQLKQEFIDSQCGPKEAILGNSESSLRLACKVAVLLREKQRQGLRIKLQPMIEERVTVVEKGERSSSSLLQLLSREGSQRCMQLIRKNAKAWRLTSFEACYASQRFYEYVADYHFAATTFEFVYGRGPTEPQTPMLGEATLASPSVLRILSGRGIKPRGAIWLRSLLDFQIEHIEFMQALMKERRLILSQLLMPPRPAPSKLNKAMRKPKRAQEC
ncbi:hypothetical protein Efla_005812 [Eimeria flavescens]